MRKTQILCDCCAQEVSDPAKYACSISLRMDNGGYTGENPLASAARVTEEETGLVLLQWADMCFPCWHALSKRFAETVIDLQNPVTPAK